MIYQHVLQTQGAVTFASLTRIDPGVRQTIFSRLRTNISDLLEASLLLRRVKVCDFLVGHLLCAPCVAQDGICRQRFRSVEVLESERIDVEEPHRGASGGESGRRPIGAGSWAIRARCAWLWQDQIRVWASVTSAVEIWDPALRSRRAKAMRHVRRPKAMCERGAERSPAQAWYDAAQRIQTAIPCSGEWLHESASLALP